MSFDLITTAADVGSPPTECVIASGTSPLRALSRTGRTRRWRTALSAALLSATAWCTTQAHAQHAGDILLATTPSGQLTSLGVRVYGVEFDPLELGEYVAANPGVDRALVYPPGYGTLPARTALSFTLEPFAPRSGTPSSLWFWSGEGAGADFSALTDGTEFSVSRGTNTATVQGGSDPVVGFTLGTTSITGGIHVHPFFSVSRTSGEDPAPGVYAVAMSFSMSGLDPSDPVFLLFATPGLDQTALPLASAWASDIAAIPEPESFALLLAGAVLIAWRARITR